MLYKGSLHIAGVVRKPVIIHSLKILPAVARSKLRIGEPLSPGSTNQLGWECELVGGEAGGRGRKEERLEN